MSATSGFRALRVFVGNLPWTISSTELRQFASSFGPVTYSQVIFDKKTGMSKGYGFVAFGTKEAYNAIMKGGGGSGSYFLEGQHIHVNPSSNPTSVGGVAVGGVSADE